MKDELSKNKFIQSINDKKIEKLNNSILFVNKLFREIKIIVEN